MNWERLPRKRWEPRHSPAEMAKRYSGQLDPAAARETRLALSLDWRVLFRRRHHSGVQRTRWRMAGLDRGPQTAGQSQDRHPDPTAGSPARPRLRLRAAETCPARLHGAEGGRDGSVIAAAGVDPLHPGRPG